jgi:peptide/nickel transport system substrate-binding protein
MLGWTPSTYDAHNALLALAATRDLVSGKGHSNAAGFSHPQLDDAIDAIQTEDDPQKRQALISGALKFIRDNYLYIPLHQQVIIWAMRANVTVAQLADNMFPLRYVTVK